MDFLKNYFATWGVAIVTVLTLGGISGCASCSRWEKTMDSDVNEGLNRTVTLYSNNGEEIRFWDGKIDLEDSDEEILFDVNGRRTIIHGGIVVVQEN